VLELPLGSGFDHTEVLKLPLQRCVSGVGESLGAPICEEELSRIGDWPIDRLPFALPMLGDNPGPAVPVPAREPEPSEHSIRYGSEQASTAMSDDSPTLPEGPIRPRANNDASIRRRDGMFDDLTPYVLLTACVAGGVLATHLHGAQRPRGTIDSIALPSGEKAPDA
jgi:hypothetical protein